VLMIFSISVYGTTIEDYNQAKNIEQNYNCITVREWHEREGTFKQATTAGGIITADGAAQTPVATNPNSDYVSPLKLLTGSADDSFEMTENNSDEIMGEVENDTPMKKSNCLNMKHRQKQTMNFLDSRIHSHSLVLQQKKYRGVLNSYSSSMI